MQDMIKIGENIKVYRESLNLSQNQLSRVFQVTPQTISRWEKGTAYPDIEKLPQIARFFGISIDELMGTANLSLYSISKKLIETRNKSKDGLPASKLEHFNLLEKTVEQGSELFLTEYHSNAKRLHNEALIDDERYKAVEDSVRRILKTLPNNLLINKLRAIVTNEDDDNLELWKDFASDDNTACWNDILLLRAFFKNQPEKWLEKRNEILFDDISKTIYLLTQRSSIWDSRCCEYGYESIENINIAKQLINCFSKQKDDIFIFLRMTVEIRLAYTYFVNEMYEELSKCINEIKMLLETANSLFGHVVSGSIDLFSDYRLEISRADYDDCLGKIQVLLAEMEQKNMSELHNDLSQYVDKLLCEIDPFYYINSDEVADFKQLYEFVDNRAKKTKNEYMNCVIAVKTSKGNIYEAAFNCNNKDDGSINEFISMLGDNYDTKLDYIVCGFYDFVNEFFIDVPSHNIRMKLCELDKRNLDAKMLFHGLSGYISKTIKQTFGPMSKLKF